MQNFKNIYILWNHDVRWDKVEREGIEPIYDILFSRVKKVLFVRTVEYNGKKEDGYIMPEEVMPTQDMNRLYEKIKKTYNKIEEKYSGQYFENALSEKTLEGKESVEKTDNFKDIYIKEKFYIKLGDKYIERYYLVNCDETFLHEFSDCVYNYGSEIFGVEIGDVYLFDDNQLIGFFNHEDNSYNGYLTEEEIRKLDALKYVCYIRR